VRLHQDAATAAAAEVPLDWAEAYYESRFGGQPLSENRLSELEVRLNELRLALTGRNPRNGDTP
jgi:hypothetical protein